MKDPMDFTDWGISIFCNDEHSEKAESLINVTEGGMIISVREEHLASALEPIKVTEVGI